MVNFFVNLKHSHFLIWSIISSPVIFSMWWMYSKNKKVFKSLKCVNKTPKNKAFGIIEAIQNYSNSQGIRIEINDTNGLEKKIEKIYEDGPNYLQVIADFDRTLSRYMHNGKPNLTCHGIFEMDPELSVEVRKEFDELRSKYMPIEFDGSLSNEEKVPLMLEWWTRAHELIVSTKLHRSVLQNCVKNVDVGLRDGVCEYMEGLEIRKIPLLVFSAGVGNVIEEILRNKNLLFDNLRIVSNFINFDKDGTIISFQDEMIHSFNKSARSIQESEFYENICTKRTSVILLGDSIGDPNMSDGLETDLTTVVKIGFLNYNAEKLLPIYKTLYDIVIVQDESFKVPQLIMDYM